MDTVYTVELRSYGFLHPGREQMRTEVLKRAWPFVPGSTLYGAVAAALIRLDGLAPERVPAGDEGFHVLLRAVEAQAVRFLPLVVAEAPVDTAVGYCRAILEQDREQRLFQAIPHAPMSRDLEKIYDNQLFAYGSHRPVVTYYGFVAATDAVAAQLRRALRLLPIIPFGGKGKFALVSGQIVNTCPRPAFQAALATALRERSTAGDGLWVRLLSPMLLGHGDGDWLLTEAAEQVVRRLRQYRIWQSGYVYDQQAATVMVRGSEDLARTQGGTVSFPGGEESRAVPGVPDGSRFRLQGDAANAQRLAAAFVAGVGHPGWRYLGWGQVVPEWL